MLAALLMIALVLSRCSQSDSDQRMDTLVVGVQSGYPPFEFMDVKGQIIGFDIDMAQHLADAMGKKLVIKDMEFDGLILALKQGKIDLIMSGMNITPSRLKEIAVVPYHGEAATSMSLIFWNEIPEGISSLEDIARLPSPTVSVEAGAIAEEYLKKRYPTIQAKPFQGALAPLMDVKYGKSMANLVEPDVAEYLRRVHPQIKIVAIPLKDDDQILGFGIGIKKNNRKLFENVEKVIQAMKDSGEHKKLEDQWFRGENP